MKLTLNSSRNKQCFIIAESPGGYGKSAWDVPEHAWSADHFKSLIQFGKHVRGKDFDQCSFGVFVNESQLSTLLSVVSSFSMEHKLLQWINTSESSRKHHGDFLMDASTLY